MVSNLKQGKSKFRIIPVSDIIREESPEIATRFRLGDTVAKLARDFMLETKYDFSKPSADLAVKYALGGVREHEGLYSLVEFQQISKINQETHRKGLGKKTFSEQKGIHGLDFEGRRKVALKALEARGNVPRNLIEISFYDFCEQDDSGFFRRDDQTLNYSKIAFEVNRNVFMKDGVRTPAAVCTYFWTRNHS